MSPRETADQKAIRYLAEGRITITAVSGSVVSARCKGDGVLYRLGRDGRGWFCTCPNTTARCCHLLALRHVIALDES